LDGLLVDGRVVEELLGLLVGEDAAGLGVGDALSLGLLGHHFFEHVGHGGVHLVRAHAAEEHVGRRFVGDGDLDLAIVELAVAEAFAQLFTDVVLMLPGLLRGNVARGSAQRLRILAALGARQEQIEDAQARAAREAEEQAREEARKADPEADDVSAEPDAEEDVAEESRGADPES
ncbi:MAG: hypothetical protein ACOC98_07365, partial [Thermodesulfobacteriota bacterium]